VLWEGSKIGVMYPSGVFQRHCIGSNSNEYIWWRGVFELVRTVGVGVGSRAREG
jgi:hypothetical protein